MIYDHTQHDKKKSQSDELIAIMIATALTLLVATVSYYLLKEVVPEKFNPVIEKSEIKKS